MEKRDREKEARNKACRACTNGWGNGICNYHHSQFLKFQKGNAIKDKRN